MVLDPETFVFVMIDEVESLTAARSGMSGGNEPGDAIRVSSCSNSLCSGLHCKAQPRRVYQAKSVITSDYDPLTM